MVMRAAEQQEQIEWEPKPTQWNMKSINEPMETSKQLEYTDYFHVFIKL
jgi:hypothetical protein